MWKGDEKVLLLLISMGVNIKKDRRQNGNLLAEIIIFLFRGVV